MLKKLFHKYIHDKTLIVNAHQFNLTSLKIIHKSCKTIQVYVHPN